MAPPVDEHDPGMPTERTGGGQPAGSDDGITPEPLPPPGFVERLTSRLEARRSSWIVDMGLFAFERNRFIPSSLFAGALASRIVIFAIPFVYLLAVVTGLYANITDGDASQIAQDAGMPGLLADVATESAMSRSGIRAVTVAATVVAAVWAANSLGRLVRRIYSLMWAVPLTPPKRSWLAPASVILVATAAMAVSRFGLRPEDWPQWLVVAEILAEVAVVAAFWTFVTGFLPRDPRASRWIDRVPGAIVVGVGVAAMRIAVVVYITPAAVSLTERYGDIAVALLLLTWSYWVAFIVIYSAEFNAAFFRSRTRRDAAR